jgi:arylsulfatase
MTAHRVILLTVDALGAEHVGLHVNEKNNTPNLSEYSQTGLSFDHCISQSSHTRESMFSLFLSKYPNDLNGVGPITSDHQTLATVLSKNNVATAGFHSNPYLSRAYNFNKGFDKFEDSLLLGRNRLFTNINRIFNYFKKRPYRRGNKINQMGLSWIQNNKESTKEFLWLHYMDPHGPYQPPKSFRHKFVDRQVSYRQAKGLWRKTVDMPGEITEDERRILMQLYDSEVRYMDHCISEFITKLNSQFDTEDTVIIIAADHGELFDRYGLYGHPRYVYHELVHVPLLIIGDQIPSKRIKSPVENLDIAPTVVDLFNINPVSEFAGRSLVSKDYESKGHAISQASAEKENRNAQRVGVMSNKEYYYMGEFIKNELQSEYIFNISTDKPTKMHVDDIDRSIRSSLLKIARDSIQNNRLNRENKSTQIDKSVKDRLDRLGYR